MEFRDLVREKKNESREAFVAIMQERKNRIDGGETKEAVEADLIAKNAKK